MSLNPFLLLPLVPESPSVRYQAQIRQMEGELRAMAAEAEAERGRGRQAAADFAAQLRAAEETVESWQERCRVGAAQAAKQQEEAAAEAQALSGQIAAKENELRMMASAGPMQFRFTVLCYLRP